MAVELKARRGYRYTPVGSTVPGQEQQQEQQTPTRQLVTWWQLLENAAKSVHGREIQVLRTTSSQTALDCFVSNLHFTVASSDPEPRRTRPTVIDITVKEYANRGEKAEAHTLLKVSKTSPVTQGMRYYFTTSQGIDWAFQDNVGAQIVGLSMAGGSMRVGGGMVVANPKRKTIHDTTLNSAIHFEYSQEEQLTVPPETKTTAKITTSTIRYEQAYVLELSTPSSTSVPVTFRTKCQQLFNNICGCCCCNCSKTRYVTARDILNTMPDYRLANGRAYFTQAGILSWIGEDCSVEKIDQPLGPL